MKGELMKCTNGLRYNLKSKGLEFSDVDKKLVEEKIINVIRKYFDDTSTVVDISARDTNGPKGGIDKEIDVVITIKGDKNPIKITERDEYITEAINKSADRVEKILRRQKDKIVKAGRFPRKYYIDEKLSEK